MVSLSFEQKRWVYGQGGRTELDVHEDEDGMFLLEYTPHNMLRVEKVDIPWQKKTDKE